MDVLGRITKNRQERHWSEYQLAERSGIPQSTISSWYKKGMTPSFSSLEKICAAFGVTMSYFLGDGSEPVPLPPAKKPTWQVGTSVEKEERLPPVFDGLNHIGVFSSAMYVFFLRTVLGAS